MALSNTIMWVSAKPPFSLSKILKPFCPKSHAQVSILNLYQPQLCIAVWLNSESELILKSIQKITEAMKGLKIPRSSHQRPTFAETVVEVLYDINERKGGFRRQEGKGVATGGGGVAEQVGLVGGGAW
ncbi:unnamed protein product [Prunus armeniaca]|uniref:Uncharacterized protein n=1 Tax=Prunus armeniaca TaxID=36596 RepID=A0A6J5WA63_PRUAR|nr:unnamed protein product [Prunus armeniaca]CAB4296855.1 unnamed protein product [Prunus armeniaca]